MNSPETQPAPISPEAARYRETLESLPLTNVTLAGERVEQLLRTMQQTPPMPSEYLALLEAIREPLAFVQDTLSSRYATKPLPATEAETMAFVRTVTVWRLMADSYARVAQLGSGDREIQDRLALICQRCIRYIGLVIVEYFRARRDVAPGLWLELHGYHDTAEEWQLATDPVAEPLGDVHVTSCLRTYGAVLLVALSNPGGRTPREISWILRWAELLAPDTRIVPPDRNSGGRGYGVDLMLDRGVLPVDHLADTPSARLFDTSGLGEKVKMLFARLKSGESPATLGLGDDCSPQRAARLLLQLYRPWCLAAMPRRFERNLAAGLLAVGYGIECIYFHVTGNDFVQPEHARTYSRLDAEKLWTFRNQMDPTQPLHLRAAELGYALDTWDVTDQSLNGFRITRSAAGPRIEHGQLIALKPPGMDQFMLGRICWLLLENSGKLKAGVNVLPGPARGVGVRPTGLGISANEPYVRGFFVPPVAALKEPISVIVPHGWYQPNRVIEVFTDRPVLVRLDEPLARGVDFERCPFTLVS